MLRCVYARLHNFRRLVAPATIRKVISLILEFSRIMRNLFRINLFYKFIDEKFTPPDTQLMVLTISPSWVGSGDPT